MGFAAGHRKQEDLRARWFRRATVRARAVAIAARKESQGGSIRTPAGGVRVETVGRQAARFGAPIDGNQPNRRVPAVFLLIDGG